MNRYFVAAAVLAFLVGLAHSVFGEKLIFRRLREGGLVPTNGGKVFGQGQVRILWASWHVLTVFGWGIGSILLWSSLYSSGSSLAAFIEIAVVISMLCGSVLVFVGTKARHPGWVGLLGVAVLVWLGSVRS